jgi:hypothetical protein
MDSNYVDLIHFFIVLKYGRSGESNSEITLKFNSLWPKTMHMLKLCCRIEYTPIQMEIKSAADIVPETKSSYSENKKQRLENQISHEVRCSFFGFGRGSF